MVLSAASCTPPRQTCSALWKVPGGSLLSLPPTLLLLLWNLLGQKIDIVEDKVIGREAFNLQFLAFVFFLRTNGSDVMTVTVGCSVTGAKFWEDTSRGKKKEKKKKDTSRTTDNLWGAWQRRISRKVEEMVEVVTVGRAQRTRCFQIFLAAFCKKLLPGHFSFSSLSAVAQVGLHWAPYCWVTDFW